MDQHPVPCSFGRQRFVNESARPWQERQYLSIFAILDRYSEVLDFWLAIVYRRGGAFAERGRISIRAREWVVRADR